MNFNDLRQQLRQFSQDRDWESFHSPKNLSMALSVEVAELVEHFQWLTQAESAKPDAKSEIAGEVADIQIYLTMLADRLGIDIEQAVTRKIQANAKKYPVGAAKLTKR